MFTLTFGKMRFNCHLQFTMKYTLFILSLLLYNASIAQNKFTISGYVKDNHTQEDLIGAYVLEKQSESATSSNVYGFYSLTLEEGASELIVSYIGYSPKVINIELKSDTIINIGLVEGKELAEAEVTGDNTESIQEQTQMSTIDLSMKKVKTLPALLGETDLLKTIQLLPGIQSGSEGGSGLYVRGGGPDQNLILLDGVPVYNATHLFGFFSVFNADAIRDVRLIKGGFPARYGGRLSSVIDVRMKEGNKSEVHGEGSVGIISAKVTLEGPIKKGKSSFLISGRRTYLDILAAPFIARASASSDTESGKGGYYFYDLNAKLNFELNQNNRLFFSGYGGDDKAFVNFTESFVDGSSEKFETQLKWGNRILAARWNHVFTPKLFSNTTLTYSKYKFNTGAAVEATYPDEDMEFFSYDYDSGIDDFGAKIDLDYSYSPSMKFYFGGNFVHHKFTPGVNQLELSFEGESLDTLFGSDVIRGNEFNVFAEVDWKVNDKFKVDMGLHSSNFFVEGEKYYSAQPRISARYLLNEKSSIKASYANMVQYLHLLSNTSIGLPTDLWVPVTKKIKPQISNQIALGYAMTPVKGYQVSVEGYYKDMQNLIEYKDGASFQGTAEDWQTKVESGRGWSYGAEVFLEKKTGKFSGWVGYTLSWTKRQFENINFGNVYPYRFDRRHDVGIALTYNPNENVDIGLVYVYGTGNSVTLPVARYNGTGTAPSAGNLGSFFSSEIEYITERNGYRMPSYHRLDLGISLHKEKDWGKRTWTIGIYNVYNRQNPFILFFDTELNENTLQSEQVLKQISLFPIIPSISYGFKF